MATGEVQHSGTLDGAKAGTASFCASEAFNGCYEFSVPASRAVCTDYGCADLGRSPACQVCGHICHFGFVQMGTERVRGAPPSATPSDAKIRKGGTQKASALLAPDEPKLVCLDHFAQLEAPPAAKGGAGGRCLFSRYDDEQLVAMATRASQRAAVHMQGEGKARTRPTLPGPSPCAARLPGAVERALKELRAKRGAKASKK